ncbi:hypothetical protein CaCOL14_011259 [Colletotrichum acutatum]
MARTGTKRNYQSLDLAEAKRPKVDSKDKKPVVAAAAATVAVGVVARASSDSGYHSDSSAAANDNDNAGERLFNKQTAKRPPPSSQLPLAARLQQRFGARDESMALAYPEQCGRGLYIYADGSNISVSFFNDLKKRMGMSRDQRLSSTAFSFYAFRGILERGREVKEGVIVGSRNNKAGNNRSSSSTSSIPLYLQEAEACDYTAKVLQRVPADTSSAGSFAMKEQGVDETVQHHMRKAVLDNLGAPGVMILATGDGNLDGDMEGGFPAAVQSALANGWVVEVYHFAESAHSTWRDPRFLHNPEWDGRLTCHALDDFVFDMDAKQHQPATPIGEVPRTVKRTRRESRPAYVPSWTLPPTQQAASVSLPPAAAAAVTPPPSPPLEMAPATPEELAQAGQIAELVGKIKPELIPVIAASLLRAASTTPPPTAPTPAPAPARIPSVSRGDANGFAGGAMGYFGAQLPSPPAVSAAAFPQPYPLQYPQATSYTAALGQYQYNGVWGNQVGYYGHTG